MNNAQEELRLLTLAEAVGILQVSERTLHRTIQQKEVRLLKSAVSGVFGRASSGDGWRIRKMGMLS